MTLEKEFLVLNENAYFYKVKSGAKISAAKIKAVFTLVSQEKVGHYTLRREKEIFTFDEKALYYSLCVFKYHNRPSFIDRDIEGCVEVKFAYLLIIEYGDYVVICRRNISKLISFINQNLEHLDYSTISRLYLSERTNFEKFTLKNFDISDRAIRNKVIEAINLKSTISGFGANKFIVSNMRVNNGVDSHALSFNTSRINKLGKKSYLDSLLYWSSQVVNKIESFSLKDSYLDYFAKPIDIEGNLLTSNPICILVLWSDIQADVEEGNITSIVYNSDPENPKNISIEMFNWGIRKFKNLCEIVIEKDTNGNDNFRIINKFDNNAILRSNKKSFTISSQKLRKIVLNFDDGTSQSLSNYLNTNNNYIVNYENIQLVYFARKLFEDSRLLGSIEGLSKMFIPCNELSGATSEKGDFTKESTKFSEHSIFNIIEEKLAKDSEYLICDDLGNEWADTISVKAESVCFYHAKFSDSESLSATKFQDVIGQAQKNLGNIYPTKTQMSSKKTHWKKKYINNKVTTNIPRLRIGDSVDNAIEVYNQRVNSPNTRIQIFLVVNFISKDRLFLNLRNLRDGKRVERKTQVIQLLWFISSYISNCNELGVEAYIVTRP